MKHRVLQEDFLSVGSVNPIHVFLIKNTLFGFSFSVS